MMTRFHILIVAVEVSLMLAAVFFEPTWRVRGNVRGEAFFEDRPTSYWRGIVEHDLHEDLDLKPVISIAPPRWWEGSWSRCKAWIGCQPPREDSSVNLLREDANGVLQQLTADADPHIAGFARDAMAAQPDLRRAKFVCGGGLECWISWRRMIAANRLHDAEPGGGAP